MGKQVTTKQLIPQGLTSSIYTQITEHLSISNLLEPITWNIYHHSDHFQSQRSCLQVMWEQLHVQFTLMKSYPIVSGVTTSISLTTRISLTATAPPVLAHSCTQPAQAGRTFDCAKPSSNKNTNYNKFIAFHDNCIYSHATLLHYTLNSLCQILTLAAKNLKRKYKAVFTSVLSPKQ